MSSIYSHCLQMRQQSSLLTRPKQLWPAHHILGTTKEQGWYIYHDVLFGDGLVRNILLPLHHGNIPILRCLEAVFLHPSNKFVPHLVCCVILNWLAAILLKEVLNSILFTKSFQPGFWFAMSDSEERLDMRVQQFIAIFITKYLPIPLGGRSASISGARRHYNHLHRYHIQRTAL